MTSRPMYTRHKLEESKDQSFQKYGDLVFYPNGTKKLGLASFSHGVSIHRHRFGANLVAICSPDSPNLLTVETPTGDPLLFLYRPWLRTWYQLVVLHDPKFYRNQERFGTYPAIGLYYLSNAVKGAVLDTVKSALSSSDK